MKEEKDRKKLKSNHNAADPDFLQKMFYYNGDPQKQPPLNRHGKFIFDLDKKKTQMQVTSYKPTKRLGHRCKSVI